MNSVTGWFGSFFGKSEPAADAEIPAANVETAGIAPISIAGPVAPVISNKRPNGPAGVGATGATAPPSNPIELNLEKGEARGPVGGKRNHKHKHKHKRSHRRNRSSRSNRKTRSHRKGRK